MRRSPVRRSHRLSSATLSRRRRAAAARATRPRRAHRSTRPPHPRRRPLAICRSCEVSPIISERSGAVASACISSRSIAGCGFGVDSSAQRDAAKYARSPVASSARSRPLRLLPVATASRWPRARSASSSSPRPGTAACILAGEELPPVALDELHRALGRQVGHRQPQRVVQAEADDVARARRRRHRQPQIARRLPDALDDRLRRVDQRAVPVKDDQVVAQAAPPRNRRISAGSGAASRSRAPVTGCAKASRRACSCRRFNPSLRHLPIQREVAVLVVADHRVAGVRQMHADLVRAPGEQPQLEQAAFLGRRDRRTWVAAACPPACTATRRSPPAVTNLCRRSRSSRVPPVHRPWTSAT
jgi:hypothetical protein